MSDPSFIDSPPDRETEAVQAAVYRRLVAHLRARTDVQNIDLMNLSGFCRNCLSRWYREASQAAGREMDKEESREIVYGMPFAVWKERHQTEADPQALAAFARRRHDEGGGEG